MTHLKRLATLTTGILITLFALPAFAETVVEVTATNAADLGFTAAPPAKPLDAIKARAQQIKADVGVNVKTDGPARMEAKMHLRASSTASTTKERPFQGLKALIKMHGGLIKERFTNALSHLNKFMARIDSRIEKMKSAGIDVTAVESLQVGAEASIDTAETDIAAVRTYVESVSDESDRATVKAELEAKIKTARESIKDAHESVRALVKALVELAKEDRPDVSVDAEAEGTVE